MVERALKALILVILHASTARGESIQMLAERASIDFVVEDVLCLLSFQSGKMGISKGQAVPLGPEKVLVGARVQVPDGEAISSYSMLVRGKEGKSYTTPTKRIGDGRADSGEVDKLRLHVASKQLQLRELEGKRRVSEEVLRKLRSDVDLVSDIGRIVVVKEELLRKQAELESARKNIELFKKFFSSVQSSIAPKGLAQRESELSRQLPELAVMAKKAELQAAKQKGQGTVDRRNSLAELGRTTDIERLEKQLRSLREKRRESEEPKGSFYPFW